MAQTIRTETGTGSPSVYNVDFDLGYLSRDHIYVYQGDDYTTQLSYTWINDGQIQVGVPAGELFLIRRVVPRNEPINDYVDGAWLIEKNLDASFAQALMITEEILDGYSTPQGDTPVNSNLDMQQNNIINCLVLLGLAAATEATAAVPLGQLTTLLAKKVNLSGDTMTGPLTVLPATGSTEPTQLQQVLELLADIDAQGVIPLVQPRQVGDSAQTTFASPATESIAAQSFFISVDGITQRPVTDFTIDGSGNVVFDEAPVLYAFVDITLFQPQITEGQRSFSSLTLAVSTVTAGSYANETPITTASYRSSAECSALSIPYPDGGGASYVVETLGAPDGFGDHAAGTKQLTLIIEGRLSSKKFGFPVNSTTPQNAVLKALLSRGIPIHLEGGDIFLESTGANTAAVVIPNYVNDLDVTASTSSNIILGDVDGDAIRITVPSNGAGLPSRKLKYSWKGGTIDQSAQKNSTTVPYSTQYPPVNVGTSATADALYFVCDYNDGSGIKSAVEQVIFANITTIGSRDHWMVAGGDSGIFCAGAESVHVTDCTDIGQRDAGVYLSGDGTDYSLLENVRVTNQTSIVSNNGVTVKRAGSNIKITGCHGENTLLPISLQWIGESIDAGAVYGNTSVNAWRAYRLDNVKNVNVYGNTVKDIGHTLEDGTPDLSNTFTYGTGADLSGCDGCSVNNNIFAGKNPLYTASNFGDGVNIREHVSSGTWCNNNTISNNKISGMNDAGTDGGNTGGSNNTYLLNTVFGCNTNRFILSQASSVIIAVNTEGDLLNLGTGLDRDILSVTTAGLVDITGSYLVDHDQVVGTRRTGWGAVSGTTAKLAFDADTADLATTKQVLGQLLKDLNSDEGGHGLIGA